MVKSWFAGSEGTNASPSWTRPNCKLYRKDWRLTTLQELNVESESIPHSRLLACQAVFCAIETNRYRYARWSQKPLVMHTLTTCVNVELFRYIFSFFARCLIQIFGDIWCALRFWCDSSTLNRFMLNQFLLLMRRLHVASSKDSDKW